MHGNKNAGELLSIYFYFLILKQQQEKLASELTY